MSNLVDHLTPDVVLRWIPAQVIEDARQDVERGRVAKPIIRDGEIAALVADRGGGRVRARIGWKASGPMAACGCGDESSPCRHVAALALMLVGGALPPGHLDKDLEEDGSERARLSPADEERRRRVERAASELFVVTPHPAARIYGRYDVTSPSSRSYEVVIRALDGPGSGCNCPDFATNLLGTCKHIQAVLHHLGKKAGRKLERAREAGPPGSYLHLHFDAQPGIRLRLAGTVSARARRLAAKFFGESGRLVRPIDAVWGDLDVAARGAGVEVPAEVARFAGRVREAAAGSRRQRDIEAEVRRAGREQPGFRATLYPYQVDGVAFLASRGRALLADDMGLGKTAQAIAAFCRLERTADVRRTLIVCPASLKHQWHQEIARFLGRHESVTVVGGSREVRRQQYAAAAGVVITSYELARTDEAEVGRYAPDLLILDEAQRIKNWRTQTAAVVKRIPSRFVFVLTGTPLENRLDDLYSILQVIDPHLLGPLWRFNQEFTALDERGKITGYRNLDRLRSRVLPVMLRRRKEDVLAQLPEQIVSRLSVSLTDEQRSIHDDAEQQVAQIVARLKKRPLTPLEEQRLMRAFQRARMACDAAGLVDKKTVGAPKLDELEGLLEEICVRGGHKVVIFSEWEGMQGMAAAVCKRLRIGHVRLHGGVPSDARGALCDRFREDPLCRVFLSTDAGGVGLNLQVASHVINLDLPWNPAVLAQRIGRVHRIGQRNAVNVVLLVSKDSFEERLEGSLAAKRELFAAAVGDDAETTEMKRATLATRIATLLGGEFAATTGKDRAAAEPRPPDEVAELRARLGNALLRVVRLPDGRLLGVVRGDTAPPIEAPVLLLSSRAVEALAPLGEASPLAKSEVLYQADAPPTEEPAFAARRDRLALAERKLDAGRALLDAGMGGEALGLLRDALALACRALDDRVDSGDDAAALVAAVYSHLIPTGALTSQDAHALLRAGELARAFAGSTVRPPEALVAEIAVEARDLCARARERLDGRHVDGAPRRLEGGPDGMEVTLQ
jgi:superfamily II DNA or RNA helicase